MKKLILIVTALALCAVSLSAQPGAELKNRQDSTNYMFGIFMASMFDDDLDVLSDGIDIEQILAGFEDHLARRTGANRYDAISYISESMEELEETVAERRRMEAEVFMAEVAVREGVRSTASGILYFILEQGSGERPSEEDYVRIDYTISSYNDIEVDSDEDSYSLDYMPDGMKEAIMLMPVGSEYLFFIPNELIYDGYSYGAIREGTPVQFRVKLIEITEPSEDEDYYDYDEDDYDYSYYDDDDEDDVFRDEEEYFEFRRAGDYHRVQPATSRIRYRNTSHTAYSIGDFKVVFEEDMLIFSPYENGSPVSFRFEKSLRDFEPYFYTHDKTEDILLVLEAQVTYDYPFGPMVYRIRDGKMTEVGHLNVCNYNIDYTSHDNYYPLNPVLEIYDADGGQLFVFNTSDIIYNPSGQELRLSGSDIFYFWDGERLEMRGPAVQLSTFRKEKMREELSERYGETMSADFGDLNGDGHPDMVYITPDEKELVFVMCRGFEPFATYTYKFGKNESPYSDVSDSVSDGKCSLYIYDNRTEDYEWTTFEFNGKKIVKTTDN